MCEITSDEHNVSFLAITEQEILEYAKEFYLEKHGGDLDKALAQLSQDKQIIIDMTRQLKAIMVLTGAR